jgi:hypothetical protein
MSIDIDDLTYDELLDLNDRILARLKHLDAADTLNAMMKLNLGSKVCFDSGKHGMQVGTPDDGRRRWKVSPQMLSPVIEEAGDKTNVIDLKKKK